jgi:hypothetical protein
MTTITEEKLRQDAAQGYWYAEDCLRIVDKYKTQLRNIRSALLLTDEYKNNEELLAFTSLDGEKFLQ